jgi:hypothetical protein
MIALCSIFRDSQSYLDRYFEQVNKLRCRVGLRLYLTEGDSHDGTDDELAHRVRTSDTFMEVSHGGPRFGSVDNPQRWAQIASVVRPTLARALEDDPDIVIWVESDLVWDTEDMVRLIDAAKNGRSVAPMVFAEEGPRFYDTWGFRQNGQRFYAHQPYFPADPVTDEVYAKIDSCGSCFATPDLDALGKWDGTWPFHAGGRLWLDTLARVRHP